MGHKNSWIVKYDTPGTCTDVPKTEFEAVDLDSE